MKRSQAVLMVASSLVALPYAAAAETVREPKMAIGYPIPAFTLVDRDGEAHHVPSADGLPMVLTFFASWCPPCRIEIPNMVSAAHHYEGKLTVLGIDLYESVEKANAYIDDMKIAFPVATLATTRRNFFGTGMHLPTGILLDKDGTIKDMWVGNESDSNPLFGRLIRVGLR